MAQGTTRSLEVVPTGAALGADIKGLDLSRAIDDKVFREIYHAWNDHLVLRFRGHRLDDDALVAFSRRLVSLTWRQRRRPRSAWPQYGPRSPSSPTSWWAGRRSAASGTPSSFGTRT